MHHWLTFSRLWLAAAFCVGVGFAARTGRVSCLAVVALLAIGIAEELTDLFDGIVARRAGAASELGGLFDPLADSLARLAIYYAIAIAGWVTIAVPFVMTARDILVAYSRIVMARTGGKTSARFAGKLKAAVQGVGFMGLVVLAWAGSMGFSTIATGGPWFIAAIVILVTAWSAFDYLHAAWPGVEQLAHTPPPERGKGGRV